MSYLKSEANRNQKAIEAITFSHEAEETEGRNIYVYIYNIYIRYKTSDKNIIYIYI